MWFNYQELFDKTKNIVLGRQDNTKVDRTIFDNSKLAHDAISFNKNSHVIDSMLQGETWAFHEIIDCIGQYIDSHYNEEEIIYDTESYENYCIRK